jgi:hypothetical protein
VCLDPGVHSVLKLDAVQLRIEQLGEAAAENPTGRGRRCIQVRCTEDGAKFGPRMENIIPEGLARVVGIPLR